MLEAKRERPGGHVGAWGHLGATDLVDVGDLLVLPDNSTNLHRDLIVSLAAQRAHVYRGGALVGVTTISSGKRGHETPTGMFSILQKKRFHRSNLYEDAPMPTVEDDPIASTVALPVMRRASLVRES
jgi:hypothetical protein